MSEMDGGRPLDDSGLSSDAIQRNKAVINEVRLLLAHQDVPGFSAVMAEFSELLDEDGPLAYLRFDEAQFDTLIREKLAAKPPSHDPEALCDALHAAVIEQIATTPFLAYFRRELQRFLNLPYPPHSHRRAACAALLTTNPEPAKHGLRHAELPAMYALFRVQLIAWLLRTGTASNALADLGVALCDPEH